MQLSFLRLDEKPPLPLAHRCHFGRALGRTLPASRGTLEFEPAIQLRLARSGGCALPRAPALDHTAGARRTGWKRLAMAGRAARIRTVSDVADRATEP